MRPDAANGADPMLAAHPSLPVVETFHSLQGEGLHAGRSAFFLRLAGCRVGCSWCDTKHSWPEASHPRRSLGELAAAARQAAISGAAFAVITGGEPLHHQLDGLCQQLRIATRSPSLPQGLPLHLETSGVDPLSGSFDWITLSPKRHRSPTAELLAHCHELKVVVEEEADLAFAERMAEQALQERRGLVGDAAPPDPALLLQPAWGHPDACALTIAFVRSHPAWRLSLQSHKWLGVR
jgi:organic radical activating enzyme